MDITQLNYRESLSFIEGEIGRNGVMGDYSVSEEASGPILKRKADPEDLRKFSEDLEDVGRDHPDTMRANPDLATDLLHLRNKARERYEKISEGREPKGSSLA